MNNNRYELFLNKKINEFNLEGDDLILNKDYNRLSYFFFKTSLTYFDKNVSVIFVSLDDDEKIVEIDIKLALLADKSFYIHLVDLYGEPDNIIVSNRIIYENEIDGLKNKNLKVKKTINEVREGKFDDNPTFILWKKQDFEIKLLMKYSQNMSEISFIRSE